MAKTVLINGCSYAFGWNPDKWFEGYNIVNLASNGGSNRRAMRTTIEWILTNGNPDYVIIPITFLDRTETFFDSNVSDARYIDINSGFYAQHPMGHVTEQFIAHEHTSARFDRFLTDLIMFTAFLQQRNIPYIMFNMCIRNMPSLLDHDLIRIKANYLSKDSGIIDLNFVGNKYLGDNGATPAASDINFDAEVRHHNVNDYHILEKYLNDYRK